MLTYHEDQRCKRFSYTLIALAFLLCLLLIGIQAKPEINAGGDANFFVDAITKGAAFARWLIGTAFFSWLRKLVLFFSPQFQSFIAEPFWSPIALSRFFNAACFSLCALHLFRNNRYILHKSLCLWQLFPLLFAAGYLEYYPVASGFLLVTLFALLECSDQASLKLAIFAGLMLPFYSAFIPFTFLLVTAFFDQKLLRNFPAAIGLTLLTCYLAIRNFWPDTPLSYLDILLAEMNYGSEHLIGRYQDMISKTPSPFFNFKAAFSWLHLKDFFYMSFFGGTLIADLFCIVIVAIVVKKRLLHILLNAVWRDWRWRTFSLLSLWALFYRFFMIPRFGPVQDIDLFSWTQLLSAIGLAYLIEFVHNHEKFLGRRLLKLYLLIGLPYQLCTALLVFFHKLPEVF